MNPLLEDHLCPVISRVDIAWLCVATNDPNPIHLDMDFARDQAGYQDVIVPGTLMIGWIGEYLEQIAGRPEKLLDWRIRFTAPLWPGEQVVLSGSIGDETPATFSVEVLAKTTKGKIVGKVSAIVQREIS